MPAKARKVTTAAEWNKDFDPLLDLPSGKTVKVRPATSFRLFLQAGIIPNALMAVVKGSLDKGVEPDLEEFSTDPAKIEQMMIMVDNIVVFIVEEPEIHKLPPDKEKRDPALLYVDKVEDMDKMFLFQWATGGTRDLAQFRRESDASLAPLRGSKTMARKTVGTRKSN
jgi:hypothetical protein